MMTKPQLTALESRIDPALLAQIAVLEVIAENTPESLALQLLARRKAIRRHLAEMGWTYGPAAWPQNPLWYDRPDLSFLPRRVRRPRYDLAFGLFTSPAFTQRLRRELEELRAITLVHGDEAAGRAAWCAEADGWPHDQWCSASLAQAYPIDLEQARVLIEYLRSRPELADWRRRQAMQGRTA